MPASAFRSGIWTGGGQGTPNARGGAPSGKGQVNNGIFNYRFELRANGAIRIAVAFVLAFVAVNANAANGQRLAEGAIRGWVRDETGASVGTALVTLRDQLTGSTRTTQAARWGEFVFNSVAAGEYEVTIEAFGHRPLRFEGVQVRGGETTQLEAVLRVNGAGGTGVDVRRFAPVVGGGGGRFTARDLERYPWRDRDLNAASRLLSGADALLGVEGLPGRMTPVYINGVPVGNAMMPGGGVPKLPLSAFRQTEFQAAVGDAEWSSGATGGIAAQTIVAGGRLEVRTFGDWLTGSEQTGAVRGPVHSGMQAGAVVSGPLVPDTSSFVLGLETWRMETPISFSPRLDSIIARVANVASGTYGQTDATPARVARTTAVSGFGRLDWRFGERNTLSANFAVTSLPRSRSVPLSLDRAGAGSEVEGLDAFMSASLATQFTDRLSQDLRIGWDRTLRDFSADGMASTLFVNDAVAVGADPLLTGRFATNTLRIREALRYQAGRHTLKAGFSLDYGFHDYTYAPQNRNVFWFSSADAFATGSAYVLQTTGESAVSFRIPRQGIFAQDEVWFGPRLKLLIGARWDRTELPLDDLQPNLEWFRLTGMGDEPRPERRGRLSPRMEIEWHPDASGRWSLRGTAGVWDAGLDPLLVGEMLANDGRTRVFRGYGAFADWPQSSALEGSPSLTLLAPGFQGARSTRAALQVGHRLSSAIELRIGGIIRRTEMLPRRTDLNRAIEPSGTDQYGREIYGTLVQQGGMITAEPGSNRRFASFDVVSSIGVDGWSEYKAFTAAATAHISRFLALEAGYTYSVTRDNWFMANELTSAAAILPFTSDAGDEWAEGPSDFDIPHRAVLGAELNLPVLNGIHLSGLYRIQSGQPFTPGFRDGVDANGDGSMRNDPAYIDPAIPGFDAIAAKWDCIRSNVDAFARRNSCRGENASFLDARLSIGLFDARFGRAELVIDALNLVSRGAAVPDHALYLVDPAATLERSGDVTAIPLIINPDFGEPLVSTMPGRMFRVGLSLKY